MMSSAQPPRHENDASATAFVVGPFLNIGSGYFESIRFLAPPQIGSYNPTSFYSSTVGDVSGDIAGQTCSSAASTCLFQTGTAEPGFSAAGRSQVSGEELNTT